jgi:hypothetical protein
MIPLHDYEGRWDEPRIRLSPCVRHCRRLYGWGRWFSFGFWVFSFRLRVSFRARFHSGHGFIQVMASFRSRFLSGHGFLFRLRFHRHDQKKSENPSLIALLLLKSTPLVALPSRRCCYIGRCFRPSPLISSSAGKCPRLPTQPHSLALWYLAQLLDEVVRLSLPCLRASVSRYLTLSSAGAPSLSSSSSSLPPWPSSASPWVARRWRKYRRITTSCAGGTSSCGLRFLVRAYAVAQMETPDASAA